MSLIAKEGQFVSDQTRRQLLATCMTIRDWVVAFMKVVEKEIKNSITFILWGNRLNMLFSLQMDPSTWWMRKSPSLSLITFKILFISSQMETSTTDMFLMPTNNRLLIWEPETNLSRKFWDKELKYAITALFIQIKNNKHGSPYASLNFNKVYT